MERRDNTIILILLGAVLAGILLLGCGSLVGGQDGDWQARRDAAVVQAVEDYTAGRITADECLLVILRAYGETMRGQPIDDGWGNLLEIVGVAIGTAVPSAGVAVSVLNKRRNATRMAELEARDARFDELEEAILKLQAKGDPKV